MSKIVTDRLAVLIDADNAQPSVATELLAEIGRYGTATVRRAYGDWTTPNLKGWREHLHELAIQPIQQYRLTVGKNSTDAAMIIDAMDLFMVIVLTDFASYLPIAISPAWQPESGRQALAFMDSAKRKPRNLLSRRAPSSYSLKS
jgi:hypothetical protein